MKLFPFIVLFCPVAVAAQSQDSTLNSGSADSIVFINPTGAYHCGPFSPENADEPLGNQGDIMVYYLGGNRIAICLNYVSHGPGFNMGTFSDTLYYDDNWAELWCGYDTACTVRFAFSEKGVNVRQHQKGPEGCCDFGNNVYVDGYYRKMNNQVPIIDPDCVGTGGD